jgi:Putative peptidoglycan binding domain/L,D-transpeptidase catalytic domain
VKPAVIVAVLGIAAATMILAVVPPAAAAVTVAGQAGGARQARLAAPAPQRELRYGLRGSDVKALQRRLAALKYYPGAANGQFGPDTLEAVWAFQEVQGLKVSGVVDPATARALRHPRGYRARYARGGRTRVEVNLRTRVLVVYRDHRVALISHISAGGGYRFDRGERAVTPTGRFHTTAYRRGWLKVPLGVMYNAVFFIRISYAIHGERTYGPHGGGVPLNPVSHGCVRIPYDIARFFHTLVRTPGTPVYIY